MTCYRVRALKELKDQQLDDLKELKEQKRILTDTVRDMAEKYEDVREQDELITERLVVLLYLDLLTLWCVCVTMEDDSNMMRFNEVCGERNKLH